MVKSVGDPEFPVGEPPPRRGGDQLPERLRFIKFVCQSERIGTLRGGRMRLLDAPLIVVKIAREAGDHEFVVI